MLTKRKQSLKDRATAILSMMQHGETVLDPADVDFVMSLLKMHPSSGRKLGCGFKSFVCLVQPDRRKCFGVLRLDGTVERFGLKQCLQPSTRRSIVHQALRTIIHSQISDCWRNYIASTREAERLCPVTGELITDVNHAVDHMAGSLFHELADTFIAAKGIDVETFPLMKDPLYGVYDIPACQSICHDFQVFHKNNARLRVLSKSGNTKTEFSRRKSCS